MNSILLAELSIFSGLSQTITNPGGFYDDVPGTSKFPASRTTIAKFSKFTGKVDFLKGLTKVADFECGLIGNLSFRSEVN
jgi:hypothetical protein